MLVSVIYNENKNCGTIHSSRLETLIKTGQIFAFRHPREWIIVGTDRENDPECAACGSVARCLEEYKNRNLSDCRKLIIM